MIDVAVFSPDRKPLAFTAGQFTLRMNGKRVPVLAQAPGMVAAYWLEPLDGVGMSVIVFDSKQSAEEAL